MFGSMDLLFQKDFYKEHNEILFITPEGVTTYVIFSVYSIAPDDVYTHSNFDNFQDTIKLFKSRSHISFDVPIEEIQQIITLSTCNSNDIDRNVIHAYKKNL